ERTSASITGGCPSPFLGVIPFPPSPPFPLKAETHKQGSTPDLACALRLSTPPCSGYSTASFASSPAILNERRNLRSLALRSNWRFAGSRRAGVVIFATPPLLFRFRKPTTASSVTRISHPALN